MDSSIGAHSVCYKLLLDEILQELDLLLPAQFYGHRQMYDHMCGKQEHGGTLTLRERQFLEEYSKIAKKQGKDAVIRRENKTKSRKEKNRP